MKDTDIIKALECCIKAETFGDCEHLKCPMCTKYGCSYYLRIVEDDEHNICREQFKDALDLINRQKAEIERLRSMNQAKLNTIRDLQIDIDRLEKTEIEIDDFCRRLCRMRMLNGRAIASFEDLQNYIKEEKSEAVKEFAERLKEKLRDIAKIDK